MKNEKKKLDTKFVDFYWSISGLLASSHDFPEFNAFLKFIILFLEKRSNV